MLQDIMVKLSVSVLLKSLLGEVICIFFSMYQIVQQCSVHNINNQSGMGLDIILQRFFSTSSLELGYVNY